MTTNKGLTRRKLLSLGGTAAAAGGAVLGTAASAHAEGGKGQKEKLPQVPRRKLGKTGQTVPILLMGGSMRFDQRFDPKLAECLRFGVNYFDVADCYAGGTAETAVGNFLQRTKARKDVWLTSKSDAHDPKGFTDTVNNSLQRLKTEFIDLYFLHALVDPDSLNADLEKTAARLKKEGKIKYFGFSCHSGTVVDLLNKAATLPWIDAIMFRYNFRQYGNKELNAAMDACAKANVGLIAMKTQGSEASFADAWKKFEKSKWNKHQSVLKAVWADERISAAVSHMDTFQKLKENIAAALDDQKLGALEWEAIERYAEATRPYACDGCDHLCNPAVDAPVQIGDTMRYLMYHDVYGEPANAKALFRALPAGARALAGVDFSRANAACPNGIDIAAHMKRASKLLA